jgi:hypothetical protein
MISLRHFLCSAVLLVGVNTVAAAQTISCASSSDDYAQAMLSGITAFASGSDADDALWRSHANIPLTAAASIAFVTSDSVCTAAANALAKLSTPVTSPHSVWVIAVGPTRYIVFDKERASARRLLAAVFDSSFLWLADFAS